MSVIGGQNPIVQDGLVYILDFGNVRSYTSGSNTAQSLIYNPVTASFVAPPAGDYSGLAAAYSVRRVVSSYSGPAMEVQSGSVSASIGFDSLGNLDTASLEAFAGSGDAFVKTWYDQSGNGRHAVQESASRQPRILRTGSVVLENNKPGINFISANLCRLDSIGTWDYQTTFTVTRFYTRPAFAYIYTSKNTTQKLLSDVDGQSYRIFISNPLYSGIVPSLTNQDFIYSLFSGSSSEIEVNNVLTSGSIAIYGAGGVTIGIAGNDNASSALNGVIQELIFYSSNQSQNKNTVKTNINSYYNIFTSSFQPTPGFDRGKLESNTPYSLDTNQSFPGFSYDQGNLTLIFTGETKTNTPLFTQADQISIVGTTSSIGYGLPTNNLGRTFPASGFDHISLRFTTGSVDCFVNGIPTAPNSIFPTGSFGTGDFIASNYSGSLGNLLVYNRELSDDEIYTIYSQQARRYGLIEQDKPYTVDSSVYAYTQAAGITGSSVITALDAFVVGLKANNLWNKMIAIYPFLGSDTVKTRYNLKDPSLNTTAITYSGSWSASDSGSYNNNTSSYGILENIKGDYYHPLISSQSIHLSYLSYDTPVSGGYLMGTEELPGLPGDIAQPAAAYSVRKVRTAYTGSAMTVRRDFDDLTFDVGFDGNGNLDTGSLLTNMTASGLTTTLPGDYSGLAAAYSLRKVSSSYSGYAVDVRKASTNASASIGFDSFGNLDTASLNRFIATGSEVPAGSYSDLAAAYSLRKVVPSYAGDAIEIQSGSVSQSIGFDSFGDLDVASIASFAGSGDAFVKTWFDQSGNNYHATQSVAANQPKIYSGSLGSVILENGKPSVQFDGINDFLPIPNSGNLISSQQFSIFTINSSNTISSGLKEIISNWDAGNGNSATSIFLGINNNVVRFTDNFQSAGNYGVISTRKILTAINSTSNAITYLNNSTLTTKGSSLSLRNLTTNYVIGRQGTGTFEYWNGTIDEIILYSSDQSSNRTYIENNINSYYGIYTPDSVSTEDAYVKTWYDQSGNNNHATQTLTGSQPVIVSNGSYVGYLNMNGKLLTAPSGYTNGTKYSHFQVIRTIGGSVLSATTNTSYTYYGVADNSGTTANGNFTSVSYYSNGKLLPGTTRSDVFTATTGSFKILTSFATSTDTANLTIGYPGYSNFYIKEQVLYTSELTASRGLIEDNINGYYNIFTHSLDSGSGYVTRWYDQSGNDNHAIQTINIKQPPIVGSGSVLLENNKPAISFTTPTVNSMGFSAGSITTTTSNYSFSIVKTPKGGNNPWLLIGGGWYYNEHTSNRTAVDLGYVISISPFFGTQILSETYYGSNTQYYENNTLRGSGYSYTPRTLTSLLIGYAEYQQYSGSLQEIIIFTGSLLSSREPISQNTNTYFNIYTPVGYNLNSNSLSLFSSPTTVAGAANAVASGLTTGGPLGLVTVSRTGSSNYTLWKNRVPNKVTTSPSVPQSTELYLNAANLNNSLFSASQNNIAYASVGAGLTDDEVYTYYELVDELQTELGRGVTDPNAFITTWDTRITGTGTVTGTSSIALPLYGTQAITASWGDGTVSLISQSAQLDRTHSYATPGVYTVSITGQGQGFNFSGDGDRLKLMDIGQWGSISGSAPRTFNGCSNLVGTATDPHIIQWTGQLWYFLNCTKFNGAVGNWDMSKVTDLNGMFDNARSFNQPLNSWDVSKVTTMQGTFQNALAFNQDIGSWNMSNVISISGYFGFIFFNATSFNNGGSPSINNWDTSKITNMDYVFYNARAFNQPIGGWDVARSTNFSYMFLNAVSFNNGNSTNINNWIFNTSSTFAMTSMFQGASVFNQPIGNWNVSKSIDMSSMFRSATSFNQNIGSWNVSSVANMSNMFLFNTAFNQDIGSWNVGNVTNTSGMFESAFSFNNSGSSTINNWNTSKINNMSGMFNSARVFNQPIGNWNVSGSTDMSRMFYSASVFNQDIGSWDISSSINMSEMFDMARDFNQNIGSWNTDNVTSMYRTFRLATSFNNGDLPDINNWNTSKVNNMQEMFNDATLFNQPIGNWDVSNVTNMSTMFRNAIAFNQDIGSWNVGNVTSFDGYWGGFMQGKSSANYSYLHTIYDGWINNKLQPNRTINFSTINYSASAAEGKALLERTYNTASIIGSNEDAGQLAITCSVNHNVVAGNKIFISGSTNPGINGVQIVLSTGSATTFTLEGIPPAPLATDGEVITGYGWNITDGNPV
jgi:surface protein